MTWFAGSIILGIAASELASASGCSCSSEDAWVVSRGLLVRSSSEVKEKDSFSETVAPEIEFENLLRILLLALKSLSYQQWNNFL